MWLCRLCCQLPTSFRSRRSEMPAVISYSPSFIPQTVSEFGPSLTFTPVRSFWTTPRHTQSSILCKTWASFSLGDLQNVTANQLLIFCEKFLRSSQEPLHRRYFLLLSNLRHVIVLTCYRRDLIMKSIFH